MKRLLQLEQFAQFAFSLTVLWWLPHVFDWWVYLLLFFAPDLAMVVYLLNTRLGAWCYNTTHHKLSCLLVVVAGYWLQSDWLTVVGVLFYAHACFDRCAGYGLKFEDAFAHTTLATLVVRADSSVRRWLACLSGLTC